MNITQNRERFLAAHKLLLGDSTTLDKFESARSLIKGLDPKIDNALEKCASALSKIEDLQKGEIIQLAPELLGEETEKQKKRKKALILFLKNYKELRSEVERVKSELQNPDQSKTKSASGQVSTFAKIASFAKGPFGIVTAIALVIAVGLIFVNNQKAKQAPTPSAAAALSTKPKIKVITFNNKKIPLSELAARTGPDCTVGANQVSHYHAQNHQDVKALDGTIIPDPGGCAYGKVSEAKVEEVETP